MSAVPSWKLSGGSSNAVPAASLGGVKSSVAAGATLFDDISGADSSAGMTDYRGVYVENTGDQTLQNCMVWIVDESDASADVEIVAAAEAVNVTMATIANELTAPATVVFVEAPSKAGGINIGSIPAGQFKGVWVRRIVAASTPANAIAGFTLRAEGDTI